MRSFAFQRSNHLSCSQLKLAVYKALGYWVPVRRDCDDRTVSAIVQWLTEDITSGSWHDLHLEVFIGVIDRMP